MARTVAVLSCLLIVCLTSPYRAEGQDAERQERREKALFVLQTFVSGNRPSDVMHKAIEYYTHIKEDPIAYLPVFVELYDNDLDNPDYRTNFFLRLQELILSLQDKISNLTPDDSETAENVLCATCEWLYIKLTEGDYPQRSQIDTELGQLQIASLIIDTGRAHADYAESVLRSLCAPDSEVFGLGLEALAKYGDSDTLEFLESLKSSQKTQRRKEMVEEAIDHMREREQGRGSGEHRENSSASGNGNVNSISDVDIEQSQPADLEQSPSVTMPAAKGEKPQDEPHEKGFDDWWLLSIPGICIVLFCWMWVRRRS